MTFNPSDKMKKMLAAIGAGILGNLLSFLSSVHKEFINTLLILLLITLITVILFEIIKPFIKKNTESE
jgi:ABC-type phosphate/phosphonate transport system permease subunit